jgi:fructose-1,6-bisphosphatase/inositol monophosphatase family enzyme
MTPNPGANAPDNVQALLDSDERLQLAWNCGREAANFLHTARPANLVIETKSTSSDLVSAMDKGAEEIIVSAIRSHFPEDGILGEEGTSLDSSNGVRWIIDPLDGTVNYLFGIPLWGVSIAVEFEGLVKLGVIVLPTQGEVYVASHNQGSWKVSYDNTALSISGEQPALAPTSQTRLRVRPTTAFARGLNAWDYAAGALLVTEAGGIVQGLADADFSQFLVASTPMIFDELRAVLQEGGAQKVLDF